MVPHPLAVYDFGQIGLGLVGGGGVAGLATVWFNARQAKATVRLEENRAAIDGFDKLSARQDAEIARLTDTLDRERREHADHMAARDATIAALKAEAREKRQ